MHIAMISTPFVAVPPKNYGGTELVISELVNGLVARGHRVTLFATGDSKTPAELRSLYPTPQWPPEPFSDMNHVSWAMREVQREDFDVVHAHAAVALALGRLMPDVPLVYTIHHDRVQAMADFYRSFPDAHFVAISADQASREGPLKHLSVIHHGLDASVYEWTEKAAEYVAFIGRFAEVKGPHTAIDAAGRAGVPIRIAGEVHSVDGPFGEREVLPRLKQPHVTYLGNVGVEEKVSLLRDARALLVPITWNEPFGLAIIEAMLSGCPVVAFPRGSVPELVEEGVTGFIARDLEEMVELIRPGGRVEGFDRERCRARAVERFGRERMVADYERLYARAAAERAGVAPLRVEPEGVA